MSTVVLLPSLYVQSVNYLSRTLLLEVNFNFLGLTVTKLFARKEEEEITQIYI